MSFFYLSPVRGEMPVYLLDTIVSKRLEYLKDIFKGNSSAYNEYVIEGSIYDNVGHFMLCIIAILGENTNFIKFFLRAEIELFKRRLNSLSSHEMRCFAKKIIRTIKKIENVPTFINPLQTLCQHVMLKEVAQHLCSPLHSTDCSSHSIRLHFKHCLTFIAKRQVELKNGVAILPCSKWKQYLTELFGTNLKFRIRETNITPLRQDPRVNELLLKIKKETFPFIQNLNSNRNGNLLLSNQVDNSIKHFPPCMLNLHRNLRDKHRLSHTQRFYYSLFLKDIGMPVEEAIDFWRLEYRKSPNGHHSCCHNWGSDEKKYLYGIRHMYGLEGARKNYTSVNCKRIQSSESACSEGGCPFKFDDNEMLKLLSCDSSVLGQINEFKSRGQYTSACVYYLRNLTSTNCDNLSFNFTPVKYYISASKCNSMNL